MKMIKPSREPLEVLELCNQAGRSVMKLPQGDLKIMNSMLMCINNFSDPEVLFKDQVQFRP